VKGSFLNGQWHVGQKVGKLTITSLSPFRQVCDCGKPTNITRSHLLLNGVRSCGCGSTRARGHACQPGAKMGIYTLIEKDEGWRKWKVRCNRCQNEQTVTESALRYGKPRRCRQCDL
jgi:phage terminase large subunit GpA-like protein